MRAMLLKPQSLGLMLLMLLATAAAEMSPARWDDPSTAAAQAGAPKGGEQKEASRLIVQPGILAPEEQVDLYARVNGFVRQVSVDLGDQVKKGDVLARLDVPDLVHKVEMKKATVLKAQIGIAQAKAATTLAAASLARAQALVESAKAGLQRAQAYHGRWQAEVERGKKLLGSVFDKQTLDEVENQLKTAAATELEARAKVAEAQAAEREAAAHQANGETGVDMARAVLREAEADAEQTLALLQYADITAPFDGVIIHRNANTGMLAGPSPNGKGLPLFTLARVDRMRVVFGVPEMDAPLVKKGMEASVRFQAFQGEVFKATVSRTAGALNANGRTLNVEIDLPNNGGRLLPGMYATVELTPKIAEPKK